MHACSYACLYSATSAKPLAYGSEFAPLGATDFQRIEISAETESWLDEIIDSPIAYLHGLRHHAAIV